MIAFEVKMLKYGGYGPVSFTMRAGERIGVTGPSGCGKTRLLRALADLDPWQGEIRLEGYGAESVRASTWRKRVAYLPSESQWWFDCVGSHFTNSPDADDMHALGLASDVLSWPVSRLSSGEKQRLGLLRTLANNRPAVLLLDEPTAHLDAERTRAYESLVTRRCADGMMAVWVTHDPEQLQRVTTRGYRMVAQGVWKEAVSWA